MNLNKWITVGLACMLMTLLIATAITPISARGGGSSVIPPSYLVKYVVYAKYDGGCTGNNGVELYLTHAGINFGKTQNGCHILARWVMSQPSWTGTRSQTNVASEIKWHCQAYDNVWLRARYWDRLNPVNIEYSQSWPQSIVN